MNACTVQLGEVCEFIRGVTFDKNEATTTPAAGKIPILRAGNIGEELDDQNDLVWVPENLVNPEQRLRRNDIAICMSSGSPEVVGKTARVPSNLHASVGSFCGIIRPKNSDQAGFLSFFFRSAAFYKHRDAIARGANIQNLRFSQFEEIQLKIPVEQQRIAELLEQADRLRRTRRYALELSDTFLPATFLKFFGGWQLATKKYPVKYLEEVVQQDRGVTYGIVQAGPHVPGGIPYIKTGDIIDGVIHADGLSRTSREIASSYRRSEVKFGDLVISIRATVGTIAVLPKELDGANLTQGTARIAPGPEVEKLFLLWQIRMPEAQRWITQQVKGSTFFEITLTRLREMPVFLPSLLKQRQFASLTERHERLRTEQREALRQADHLFQSLLHCAFS